ncbi:hypothetical protein CVT26_000624 [Gymnopilus dilepis]|uniref:Uncharacterized protein n=1 Tax=Gymnopilus dilepis TaxID=231916 RepID=A0A409Y2A8_9AGAR|nr:hypothetical protein CVT26_000624 [Gymnopilus dilepis]
MRGGDLDRPLCATDAEWMRFGGGSLLLLLLNVVAQTALGRSAPASATDGGRGYGAGSASASLLTYASTVLISTSALIHSGVAGGRGGFREAGSLGGGCGYGEAQEQEVVKGTRTVVSLVDEFWRTLYAGPAVVVSVRVAIASEGGSDTAIGGALVRWACRPTVIGFIEAQVIFTSAEDIFKLQTFFIHSALSIIRHSMAPGLSGFSGVVAAVDDMARYLVSRSGWMSSTATTQCFSSSTHPHRHFLEPSGLSYASNRRHTSIVKNTHYGRLSSRLCCLSSSCICCSQALLRTRHFSFRQPKWRGLLVRIWGDFSRKRGWKWKSVPILPGVVQGSTAPG